MCSDFGKYVVMTCNDDGKTLMDIINILLAAPAWCLGYGITQKRMELVFHILVLHKENREEIIREMKIFLNKYDPVALKVYANADDAYRHTLNYDAKMIAYTEKHICEVIGKVTEFIAA